MLKTTADLHLEIGVAKRSCLDDLSVCMCVCVSVFPEEGLCAMDVR